MLPTKTQSKLPKKISAPSALARALSRTKAKSLAMQPVRIGFLIDATGSRAQSWEQAQGIQAGMFKTVSSLRSLALRLIHFGGGSLTDHGWQKDPRALAAKMAAVACARGLTQHLEGLSAFLDEVQTGRPHVIIVVGDFFEESSDEADQLAKALKDAGIKVFAFLEGDDWTAKAVFRGFAQTTGGAFAKLGDDLPLADLCEGVALLTAGGEKAVMRLTNNRARQLLLTGPAQK